MKLRDYQEQAKTDLRARFNGGDVRVPIVMATGLGKTVVFASFIDDWLIQNPGRRALVIAHTDELIQQAVNKIKAVAPGRRVGVVKAERNETLAEIIVSSRQTLASVKRRSQLRHVGLIVVDECHHATRHNTYGKILEHFGAFDEQPAVHVVGFTATLARSDKQKLSSVWQACSFTRDILFGIRHGYLLDVRGERITVPDFDLSRVRMSAGDYSDKGLGEELERTFAPEVIAREYLKHAWMEDDGQARFVRRGIAFWPLVDTSYSGAEAFNEVGIRSAVVHGKMAKTERRALLQRFALPLAHPEAIDVMHNAMVLTEGFDEPTADVVVIARPTKSAPLYQQMVGRVLRPDLTVPPKQRQKALVLDVHGVGAEHGLRSLIDLTPERKRPADGEYDESLSLLEMDEYLEQVEEELDAQRAGAGFTFESDEYRGETKTETFDPLGRDKVWGQTPAGTFYINSGNAYVFLVESLAGDPGTYDVVMCSPNAYVRDDVAPWARGTAHMGLPLDMALNWGEDLAVHVGGHGSKSLTGRKSKWRGGEPTQAQKNYAARLGIALDVDGVPKTKGRLSEEIDAVNAARRIDPLVAFVTKKMANA